MYATFDPQITQPPFTARHPRRVPPLTAAGAFVLPRVWRASAGSRDDVEREAIHGEPARVQSIDGSIHGFALGVELRQC